MASLKSGGTRLPLYWDRRFALAQGINPVTAADLTADVGKQLFTDYKHQLVITTLPTRP